MNLLPLPPQHGVSFRNQAFSPSALSPGGRLREDALSPYGRREEMEEPGSCCFLGPDEILVLLLPLGYTLLHRGTGPGGISAITGGGHDGVGKACTRGHTIGGDTALH